MGKSIKEAPLVPFDTRTLMTIQGHMLLAKQAQEDGPVLRWIVPYGPLSGLEMVFLVGPEANRFLMQTHREHFSHAMGWKPAMGALMGKGLFTMDPPEHTRHRKLWNAAFTQSYIEHYLPLVQHIIEEHTTRWAEQGEIDLSYEARELSFHIAASVLTGIEDNAQVAQVHELFRAIMNASNVDPEGYEERYAQAERARDELADILMKFIDRRCKTPADKDSHDPLGLIIHARDEVGNELSDEELLGHAKTLLLGHESSITLNTLMLYSLATLPEQRQRIEDELYALLGDSTGHISVADARQMKILDNFIKEIGRFYTPVFIVPRMVTSDVEFAGYTIPAYTPAFVGLAASHQMSNVFDNPGVFDPDRFATPREEDKRSPYGLVTFGGGPRLCIGVHFAQIEAKALAAHVLRSYQLNLVSDQPPLQVGFVGTCIANSIPLQITARSRKYAASSNV